MSDIDSMPGKLDALTGRVGALEKRLHETTEAVDENTRITRQIEQHTGVLVAHTGALLEMAHLYGDVKTTAKTTVTGVTWTSTLIAKLAVIGGAVAAAWHWLWPKG